MTTAATSTSERIILTAERLFGERGLGSVSLREIAVAAGQRNSAAVHYHFGNKDALVQAVFDHRMAGTNAHRLSMLAAMTADGRDADLRALLEALVTPLAAATGHADSHFGAFLLQLASVPPYRINWDWESAESVRLVWRGIARCLALSGPVADERKKMLTNLVIHTVADHERSESDVWQRQLIDAAAGLLSAPDSTG
ncbi:TetR/AcrR family transcriptional regulator [Tomitella gaofuii]|uniref:TetR/AcrR family transcriptional regulator n=1 Tax=Tomitella gaofuii TaxID=2760083 RepID=UPI0015FAB7FF|nr:helix-turn-helix domain-containing protein [Tomitella gaofuii]